MKIDKIKKRENPEAKFHTKLVKWINNNIELFPKPFKFETKVVRKDSKNFTFKELSAKEERLLLNVKNSHYVQTHSDLDRTGTHCDGDCLFNMDSYIIIRWEKSEKYNRKYDKLFYVIDIDDFLKAREVFKKPLTEEVALIIAFLVGELK